MKPGAWMYVGYVLWLCAGCLDFDQHRRSNLAHTSGVSESSMHALQLMLLGMAMLAWLLFQPSMLLGTILLILVSVHTVAGYVDTRVAFGVRPIGPFEQHLHSVLDMAPWFALCVVLVTDMGAIRQAGWSLAWRHAPLWLWGLMLLPALLLCLAPWLAEYRAALRARSS